MLDAARQGGIAQPESAGQRRQHKGSPHPTVRRSGRRNGRHDACRGRRAGCCTAGNARMDRARISRPCRNRRLIRAQCVEFGLFVLERALQLLEFAARRRLGQRRRRRPAAVQFFLTVAGSWVVR
jgi:hypothetical protein